MKAQKKLWLTIILIQIGSIVFSQSVYFNNRYKLNMLNGWSTSDGMIEVYDGYIITGATVDTIDFWWRRIPIVKIDKTGQILWKKDYGDYISDYYTGYPGSFIKKDTNNFFLSGAKTYYQPRSHNVGYLMKFNSVWDTVWTKQYYGDNSLPVDTSQHFNNIEICHNSDFVFAGELYIFGETRSNVMLLKTDSLGNFKWKRIYGYAGNIINKGYSVIQTTDSGFAIGGYKYTPGHSETGDPIVIKTDSLGNQQWTKNLGGPIKDNKAMLCLDYDGNILVGTNYGDEMSGDDVYSRINIIKLDNEGNIIWNKKYGKSMIYNYLLNILVLSDSNIIAVGTIPSTFPHTVGWLLKVSNNGDSLWYREYDILHGNQSMNQLNDVIETSDNGLLSCGYVFPMQPDTGTQDAWVIKLDSIGYDTPGCDTTVAIPEIVYKNTEDELYIYPNPASNVLNIQYPITNDECKSIISIYDVFGRKVKEIKLQKGQQQLKVDISNWHNGLYIAVLKDDKKFITKQKFVVLR